ncbi:MAG TPA: 2'-5' RNA ligase family protein [Terriglobales bacterium]
MQGSRYALVAYVRNPVGEFVERIRKEMHPELPHLAAHVTVLPPRVLAGSEESAIDTLHEVCSQAEPFEVNLGEVETFIPVTPTVFIRVVHAAIRVKDLHNKLNTGALQYKEEWSYMPHMTIVKMGSEDQAQTAYRMARRRWAQFKGDRSIRMEELVFVREEDHMCWKDLASIRLGHSLAVPKNQ